MSNSIGNNLLHQSSLPSTVLEPQNRINSSSIGGNTLLSPQATSIARKSPLSTKFRGCKLTVQRRKLPMGKHHYLSGFPQAVLTTDSSFEVAEKFKLEGNIELQVDVRASTPSSPTIVHISVTSNSNSLLLHWGAIQSTGGIWVLPSRRPDGTKVYKNRALRTPFLRSGSIASVRIEIEDPAIQAIEFLILDEAQNKWFKNNGNNFFIKLPAGASQVSNVSVPEDLVQIQAYLRWERKGKQMYTPEQEKVEYEAARKELLDEIARGTSIKELRARLNKTDAKESKDSPLPEKSNIPDDLVQIQAYIRWEKAGKPNFSPEQQLMEFEEARKELQLELEKGTSLSEIREKITKGEIKTKVAKQLEKKSYFTAERIQRKKRDIMQLLNKYPSEVGGESISVEPKPSSAFELFANLKEEQIDGSLLNKKIFDLGDAKVLVLVMKSSSKTKVYLATDIKDPVILHWALSERPGEWMTPPSNVLPPGSVTEHEAVETHFSRSYSDDLEVQSLELEFEDDKYVGMPFVLLSNRRWIKNKGSDFYVEFGAKPKPLQQGVGDGRGTAKALLDQIADKESEAEKSFMHRFNIAADLMEKATSAGELGLAGILVWMRFMATRQLTWNKNYNVKPREISKAQDRLTDLLQNVYATRPQFQELLRMIMSTVGRGGEGDVGQRIRDEILVIQRNNDCKGGMMEEWHQKLHNNTSPDDVVICQALINYIKSDMDISVYWKTLNENGITKERLLSYDRAIHSEPNFRSAQKDGLLRDLGRYMRTLKAVHSGADLESAISNCMGYIAEGQGFMVGVEINPVPGLPSGFPELLRFVLEHIEEKQVETLLEGLVEARQDLRPLLFKSNNRLKDLIFLDIALDSSVRTAVERGYEELNSASPQKIMHFISLVLENLSLSVNNNEDLIYCLKGWEQAINMSNSGDQNWALFAKSVLDRTRLALTSKAEWYHQLLQPSAEYLGSKLGVDQWAVNIFTEEMIRAGSAASLSTLLNRLDPVLRETAHLGSWQVISPVEAVGYVVVVDELLSVQNKSYEKPTILVAKSVKGEEEIPDGTVAVLTPDMPDVLSHVSVRARNSKVCFATCFDSNLLADLQAKEGRLLRLKPTSADIIYSEVSESEIASSSNSKEGTPLPSVALVKKQFGGRYAISSEEFTNDMVGAKSRNIAYLKVKVPSWIGIPTSVALPFGVFEKVLSDDLNQEVAVKLGNLKKKLHEGEFDTLGEIRRTVLELVAPPQLIKELKDKMQSSGMPWPGDEGQQRWEQAWMAIKKVWASKWNERAYFSTRKVKLDHDYLCMAVLVQEIINADYAFVIHTTNPSSGDSSEIYAEVVKGLGETLVGAYPGRALSFICKKNDLNSPQVLGYPSKPIGLFIKRSIIFRSDSNGEDLEGYAGAGLYDSVPMDEEEKVALDYSSDRLINDRHFRQEVLSNIARAGSAIEELYGSPQDIEGVVRDGKIYVVQTRPQMTCFVTHPIRSMSPREREVYSHLVPLTNTNTSSAKTEDQAEMDFLKKIKGKRSSPSQEYKQREQQKKIASAPPNAIFTNAAVAEEMAGAPVKPTLPSPPPPKVSTSKAEEKIALPSTTRAALAARTKSKLGKGCKPSTSEVVAREAQASGLQLVQELWKRYMPTDVPEWDKVYAPEWPIKETDSLFQTPQAISFLSRAVPPRDREVTRRMSREELNDFFAIMFAGMSIAAQEYATRMREHIVSQETYNDLTNNFMIDDKERKTLNKGSDALQFEEESLDRKRAKVIRKQENQENTQASVTSKLNEAQEQFAKYKADTEAQVLGLRAEIERQQARIDNLEHINAELNEEMGNFLDEKKDLKRSALLQSASAQGLVEEFGFKAVHVGYVSGVDMCKKLNPHLLVDETEMKENYKPEYKNLDLPWWTSEEITTPLPEHERELLVDVEPAEAGVPINPEVVVLEANVTGSKFLLDTAKAIPEVNFPDALSNDVEKVVSIDDSTVESNEVDRTPPSKKKTEPLFERSNSDRSFANP